MKIYTTGKIRNIAVCGASGSGKTQLVESILYTHKIINRLGTIQEGNTVSDYDPIEKERTSSFSSSVITFDFDDMKFNFIDTPGYVDFFGDAVGAVNVSDVVLIVINPHEELNVVTKKIWKLAAELKKTVILFVNFMDNAPKEFDEIVENLKALSTNIAPLTAPFGKAENLKGIIKIVENVSVCDGKESEIPDELKDEISQSRENLMDSVAACDDDLMEKFLDEGSLNDDDILKGLSQGLLKCEIVPLLCGSAIKSLGIKELVEFIKVYCPSPADVQCSQRPLKPAEDFKALVFKAEVQKHVGQVSYIKVIEGSLTAGTHIYNLKDKSKHRVNQISLRLGEENINVNEIKCGDICSLVKMEDVNINDTLCLASSGEGIKQIEFPQPVVERAVYPASKGDEEKIAAALSNIVREDTTIKFAFNSETKEMIIAGVGTLQLNLVVKRIKNRYGAEVELMPPKIPYKETARKIVANMRGKYKKQTGGRGQYGDTVIKLEPMERGKGFEFVNNIVGGRIPAGYIPSVEKGIKGAMEKGVIAGYNVVDITISLFDGSYHDVDSSDMAFQIAGSLAFQNAMKEADTYILEPIMKVKIKVSNDHTGAVMGDLNSRRGRVLGMEPDGDVQAINAFVPKGLLTTYMEDLRSITSGEGEYTAEFDHYEEAPHDVQQKLIEIYQKHKEEGR